LAKFAELSSIKFLQGAFGISRNDVLLLPYNDCLVEFMLAKEQDCFADRLTEIYNEKTK